MVKVSTKDPVVKCYADGTRELMEDVVVEFNGCIFTVPAGTCGDSSIPRFAWRVCGAPTTGPNLLAGIIHDRLYDTKLFDRRSCDQVLYEVLVLLKKPVLLAYVMWAAVRLFGGSRYK